jgi:hypothetical protein
VLKSENASLKNTLSQNGFSVPEARSPVNPRGSTSPAECMLLLTDPSPLTGETSSAASVTIDLTELTTIEPERWCAVTAAMEDVRPFEQPTISPAQLLSDDNSSTVPVTLREGSTGGYGASPAWSPQAAIDFVLE